MMVSAAACIAPSTTFSAGRQGKQDEGFFPCFVLLFLIRSRIIAEIVADKSLLRLLRCSHR